MTAALRGGSVALAPDFAVRSELRPENPTELADALRSLAPSTRVRLVGRGSRQTMLPMPFGPVTLLRLDALSGITRLEPEDLTCSVLTGLERGELASALAEHDLELPCDEPAELATDRPSSIGGLFAAGFATPTAPGRVGARGSLLGLSGVLAEGLSFKAGARVVKSVAGFDLQKVFVGSRGLLFAATELHLRLRPAPRARGHFAVDDLDLDEALTRFRDLRLDPFPPVAVELRRHVTGAFAITGRFEGGVRTVAERLRAHRLSDRLTDRSPALQPAFVITDGFEVLHGAIRPSRIAGLLAMLPPRAPIVVDGVGGFRIQTTATETDAVLTRLPTLDATAEIRCGAAHRRGSATPIDVAAKRVASRLRVALDPHARLA